MPYGVYQHKKGQGGRKGKSGVYVRVKPIWNKGRTDLISPLKGTHRVEHRMGKGEKEIRREDKLRRRFGITVEEYDRMLKEQGGRCFICLTDKYDKLGRRLAVDHDHKTGKVRGLLCCKCNFFIEYLSEGFMVRAISYIKKHKINGTRIKN